MINHKFIKITRKMGINIYAWFGAGKLIYGTTTLVKWDAHILFMESQTHSSA